MEIGYEIDEYYGGIYDADKYELDNSSESLKKYKNMQKNFFQEFKEFSEYSLKKNECDYELAKHHKGVMCLFVYIYSDIFFNENFIPRVLNVLEKSRPCFAEFECYNGSESLGDFQVYTDKVCFSKMFEERGNIDRLCNNRDKAKLFWGQIGDGLNK